ncbi:MAG: TraB/GumN family protein [Sphingomonadales bacterium]|nr:TraB/GumN family protein [Sphingomonadales bacterium]
MGLETAEYQLGLFDGLPEETQIRFLMESARDLDASIAALDDLVTAWAAGDPESLAQLMNEGLNDPLIYDKLLTQRNANWAHWIAGRMQKPGIIFIAVGAGHLSGPTSVPYLMTAYGLKAERVNY